MSHLSLTSQPKSWGQRLALLSVHCPWLHTLVTHTHPSDSTPCMHRPSLVGQPSSQEIRSQLCISPCGLQTNPFLSLGLSVHICKMQGYTRPWILAVTSWGLNLMLMVPPSSPGAPWPLRLADLSLFLFFFLTSPFCSTYFLQAPLPQPTYFLSFLLTLYSLPAS